MLWKINLKRLIAQLNLNNKSLIKAQEQKAKFKDLFKEQPQILGEYENLVLQIKIANENLNGILSSKENFEFQIAQENKPWKIISNAEFSNIPVKPNVPNNLLFSIIIGITLGIVAAIIRDRFDDVYNDIYELPNNLKKLVVGNIPYNKAFKRFRLRYKYNR